MRKVLFLSLFLLVFSACTGKRQETLIRAADEKTTQGQYLEAVDLLKKAIAVNPESKLAVKALQKLGFTLESYTKDYEGAVFNYQEFIRLSTDKVSIYEIQKRIANLYFEQMQDNDKAIAAYKRLMTFSPDSLEADFFQFRIAQSFFRQNNFEQARYEFQQELDKFPKSQYVARARFNIGNAYYMEGKYDIAIEALKQVLRHHPQSEFSTESQFLIAQCMEHQEKLDAALTMYENIEAKYSSPEIVRFRINELKKRLKQSQKEKPR